VTVLFDVREENGRTHITETLPNGAKLFCDFNLPELAEAYMRNRRDIINNGLEATLQSWHDEEAVERERLGLKVKASY
jgi:hypothetical protein